MSRPTLTHVALHVRNLEACVRFYQDFCGLEIVHRRSTEEDAVVWLAEPGRERRFVLVVLPGGPGHWQADGDFGHLGFAVGSRDAVDSVASLGREQGRLAWPPRDEPPPVGYYCGIRDPDGRVVEFSYGQPFGPDAAGR